MSLSAARDLSGARRGTGWLIDGAIAAAAFGGTLALLAHGMSGSDSTTRQLDFLGVVLAAASTLPLLAWRRHPLGVFVATTAASATINLLGYPGGPPLGPTAALFLLASSRDAQRPWTHQTTAVVVSLFAAHFAAYAIGHGTIPVTELALGGLVWAVAWFAGDRTRLRRAEVAELKERAARAEQEAERERRLAAAEERARIARDLHDSAGHAINVIAVQASAARLLADQDPVRSRAALETIEEVARQTVDDIDQIVRSLCDGTAGPGTVEAPPGLAALATLIADHARTGLNVHLATSGEPRPLVSATDQAAYRILQEALTNAADRRRRVAAITVGDQPRDRPDGHPADPRARRRPARGADAPRARGARPDGAGALERRDRRCARSGGIDHQDARQAHPDEARRA